MSRCSGACCKNIGLSVSPDEMRASYMRFIEAQNGRLERTAIRSSARDPHTLYGGGNQEPIYEDIHLTYPMLTFLYEDNTHPEGDVHQTGTVYHYKCKNFVDGDCSIYAIRPRMCSSFGSGDTGCGYKKCTWKEATDKRKKLNDKRLKGMASDSMSRRKDVLR